MPYTIVPQNVKLRPIIDLVASGYSFYGEITEASNEFDVLVIEHNLTQSQLPDSQDDYLQPVKSYMEMFFAWCVYRNLVGGRENGDLAFNESKFVALEEFARHQLRGIKERITAAMLTNTADEQDEVLPSGGFLIMRG
jgi:hypothetical protein